MKVLIRSFIYVVFRKFLQLVSSSATFQPICYYKHLYEQYNLPLIKKSSCGIRVKPSLFFFSMYSIFFISSSSPYLSLLRSLSFFHFFFSLSIFLIVQCFHPCPIAGRACQFGLKVSLKYQRYRPFKFRKDEKE